MYIKVSVLYLLLIMLVTNCFAQTTSIDTDRPDQSDGVSTVPKNKFQVENGLTFAEKTIVNNFVFRYGLTHSTELRLLLDAGKESELSGLKPITVSFKQRLIEQQTIIPAITLVGYIAVEKLATKDFQSNRLPIELKLAFENELNDKLAVGYNIGTSDSFQAMNISALFSYKPTEKLSAFIEYFTVFNSHNAEHNFDTGLLFSPISNLQFDIALGRSIGTKNSHLFATCGVSYLF